MAAACHAELQVQIEAHSAFWSASPWPEGGGLCDNAAFVLVICSMFRSDAVTGFGGAWWIIYGLAHSWLVIEIMHKLSYESVSH